MTKNSVFVSKLRWKQTESPIIKNMVHSLASRNNQDGISKSNTASLLAETIVNDKNAKEKAKNKVNQKDPPPLNKNILAASLKLK